MQPSNGATTAGCRKPNYSNITDWRRIKFPIELLRLRPEERAVQQARLPRTSRLEQDEIVQPVFAN